MKLPRVIFTIVHLIGKSYVVEFSAIDVGYLFLFIYQWRLMANQFRPKGLTFSPASKLTAIIADVTTGHKLISELTIRASVKEMFSSPYDSFCVIPYVLPYHIFHSKKYKPRFSCIL